MSKATEQHNASGPDAALLALVAEYLAAEHEASALCEALDTIPPPPDTDPRKVRVSVLYDRACGLEAQIVATPARTAAGMRAKAQAAHRDLQTQSGGEGSLAWSAVCDVLALMDAA
jgi:hypothetical protein